MVTKHFFKVLFIFFLMIALGLASIIIVNSYDDKLAESRALKEAVSKTDSNAIPEAEASPCTTPNC